MKTIFVLVDALKSLYLTEENMPFLYSLSKENYYIKEIIPCAGFCERSEIFSGLDGFDTGNFTAIGYLPEHSPYKKDEFILKSMYAVGVINNKIARFLLYRWRFWNKRALQPYRIPFLSLMYFSLTEDGNAQLIPHRTIFQSLDDKGMSYTLDGMTSLSDLGNRTILPLVDVVRDAIGKRTDFIPVYIGKIDQVGHLYGNDIDRIVPYLHEVDSQLESLYRIALEAGYYFCVLGDHGMVPVARKVDVMKVIKTTGYKMHKDYEAFYDSTLARFWFKNEKCRNKIREVLEKDLSTDGFIVDKTNYTNYRIPLDVNNKDGNPVYGDLVWCAHPGVLISPDFFHVKKESENGMHGYIELVKGHGTGLFVKAYSGGVHEEIEVAPSSQICGELCEMLGIRMPNSNEWRRQI